MATAKRRTLRAADAPPAFSEAALADLSRSGITESLALALGVREVDKGEAQALGHDARGGLLFRYYDPFTDAFLPEATFHRLRYLDPPAGFAGVVANPQRYSQPRGSLNRVYVPRRVAGVDFDWKGFLADPNQPFFITEGEKKAACACEHAVPCVALGGVDVFAARGRGAHALPFFDQTNLSGRGVYVVFDTDSSAGLKDSVLESAKRLMLMLLERGAVPRLITLPADENGGKMGLDDYLVKHGADRFGEEMERASIDYTDARTLMDLARSYAYVMDIDRFATLDPERPLTVMTGPHLDGVSGLRQVAMRRLERVRVQGGYDMRYLPRPMSASDALRAWPASERFSSVVYRPGVARVVEEHGARLLNLWTGWRADAAPEASRREMDRALSEWFWALDNVFGDDAAAREFVEHWIFYPMRHPGAKLTTFALVCSPQQGIGKSFIGHMIAKHVYGLVRPGPCHAWQLTEGDLHGQFNPFIQATSFVEGDDVAAHDRKSVYERVKSFVTSDTVQINLKNVPQFMLENRANFWLTSNEHAPFYLDSRDRRAFVHTPRRAEKNPDRYRALQAMFDSGVAGRALLRYARERYDPKGFNENTEAPMTESKRTVVGAGRSAAREWAADLVAEPGSLTRPYATIKELHALLTMEVPGGERTTVDALGHALRDGGAVRWASGGLVPVRGERSRVWVLGDFERTLAMPRDALTYGLETTTFGRAGRASKF